MILPSKHIKIAESIFGLSGVILNLLKSKQDLETLWFKFEKINNTELFPAYHNYDNFIYAIDLLFLMGLISINDNGEIIRCS